MTTAADVAAFLKANPGFFNDHADVLAGLDLPARHNGEGVVDMQSVMIERLRREKSKLEQTNNAIVENASYNNTLISAMCRAALLMLDAKGLEAMVETITKQWPDIMDVDVVALAVEAGDDGRALPHSNIGGVAVLEPGAVSRMIGSESRKVLLSDSPQARETVYGTATPLVKSDALVRLLPSAAAPTALLAFGSRREGMFHEAQATDVVEFLGGVVERLLRQWLDLP